MTNNKESVFSDFVEVAQWMDKLAEQLIHMGETDSGEKFKHALLKAETMLELSDEMRTSLMEFEKTDLPKRMELEEELRSALEILGPRAE